MSEFLEVFTRFPSTQSVFGFVDVLVNCSVALFCAIVINATYQRTHRAIFYAESFLPTLVMMTVITAVIMMIIGSNIARAFSLVGALSIIRFRTAVKDIKDTGFIFFSIAVGMAVGTGFYIVAISLTFLLCGILLVLDLCGYGRKFSVEKLLMVEMGQGSESSQAILDVLAKHTRYHRLVHTDSKKDQGFMKMTYTILSNDKKDSAESTLVGLLEKLPDVRSVRIFSGFQDHLVL